MTGRELIQVIQENGLEDLQLCESFGDSEVRFTVSEEHDAKRHYYKYVDKVIDIFDGSVTEDVLEGVDTVAVELEKSEC